MGDSEHGSEERAGARAIRLDLWSGRRWAWAVLAACAIAYLVFRGTPAVAFILERLRAVGVTVLLAIVLAYVVLPLVDGFCALRPFCGTRFGRAAAALLVFVLLAFALACLVFLTADPIVRETGRLYGLVETWLEDAPGQLRRLMSAYAAAVPPEIEEFITARAQAVAGSVVEYAGAFAVGAVLRGWYIVEALLVPVLAYYFVLDADQLRAGFLRILPDRWHPRARMVLADVNRTMEGYVRGQLILCLIAAIVTSTALYLLGVRVFLTLGILAGLARAIPVIGPMVTAVPIVAIAWIQVDGRAAVIALAVFAIMHFVESKLIMPKVIGLESALHPVVVIVSLLIGGEFLGITGMFVAVPIAAVVRVLFLHWKEGESAAEPAAA